MLKNAKMLLSILPSHPTFGWIKRWDKKAVAASIHGHISEIHLSTLFHRIFYLNMSNPSYQMKRCHSMPSHQKNLSTHTAIANFTILWSSAQFIVLEKTVNFTDFFTGIDAFFGLLFFASFSKSLIYCISS